MEIAMNTKTAMIASVILLAAALGSMSHVGRSGSATIKGTVLDDNTGKPIVGAWIELAGVEKTKTDSAGSFTFTSVVAGTFEIVVTFAGYQKEVVKNVHVKDGGTVNLTIRMSQGSVISLQGKDIAKEETERHLGIKTKQAAKSYSGMGAVGGAVYMNGGGFTPLNPPNGQKYWDMYHSGYGTNPFIDTEDDHLSTFGADVSTGSYSLVRNYLTNGALPPKEAFRVEEFVNYFKTYYTAPKNKTFAFYFESAPSVITKNAVLLKIGLKGREVAAENRKSANLTFVIDVSGSMNIENRLGLVKHTLFLLLDQMKPNDRVGIVTYGSQAQTVLNPTSDKKAIRQAIEGLYSEGSTNAEAGLWQGYKLASTHFNPEAINRVILCTDGVANNGETSSEGLLKNIDHYRKQGITLTACGFGMGNYNDVLIERLATKGDGTYYYIDDLKEAKRVFVEQLTGTLQVIAKDTKIQVDFDPNVVSRYRLIGYEKRDVRDEDFRNDTIDGGEIGSGHSVTALYEVKLKNADARSIGKISIRYKSPDESRVDEISETMTLQSPTDDMHKAGLTFLSAVTLYSEIMRESYWAKYREVAEVKDMLEELPSAFRKGYDQYEDFYDMVRMTVRLQKSKELGAR
jgi:Ca-activated chloride channel family protein